MRRGHARERSEDGRWGFGSKSKGRQGWAVRRPPGGLVGSGNGSRGEREAGRPVVEAAAGGGIRSSVDASMAFFKQITC